MPSLAQLSHWDGGSAREMGIYIYIYHITYSSFCLESCFAAMSRILQCPFLVRYVLHTVTSTQICVRNLLVSWSKVGGPLKSRQFVAALSCLIMLGRLNILESHSICQDPSSNVRDDQTPITKGQLTSVFMGGKMFMQVHLKAHKLWTVPSKRCTASSVGPLANELAEWTKN